MTDVEFSNLLSELNKSASELNAGTETVNSVLASVETQLIKMNLGFELGSRFAFEYPNQRI
jgi:hypothetical protein